MSDFRIEKITYGDGHCIYNIEYYYSRYLGHWLYGVEKEKPKWHFVESFDSLEKAREYIAKARNNSIVKREIVE